MRWIVGLVAVANASCVPACNARSDTRADVLEGGSRDAVVDDVRSFDGTTADVISFDAPLADTQDEAVAGWERYAILPDGCTVSHASEPTASVPPLVWLDCADGTPGCLELAIDWGSADRASERLIVGNAGWHDGTRGWLALREQLNQVSIHAVVGSTSGIVAGAWSYALATHGGPCRVTAPALGGGRFAFSLESPTAQPFIWALIQGPLTANASETLGPIVTLQDQGDAMVWPQFPTIAASLWASSTEPFAWIVRATTSRWDLLARSTLDGEDLSGGPSIVGNDVLYTDYGFHEPDGSRRGVVALRPATGPTVILVDTPGMDVLGTNADATDLAWVVGIGLQGPYQYDRYELWHSPYATVPSSINPHFVGPIANAVASADGYFTLGFHRVGVRVSSTQIRIYELPDGGYWDISVPAGSFIDQILYLGPDEVAYEVGSTAPDIYIGTLRTIVRRRFDSLGPANPPIPRAQ